MFPSAGKVLVYVALAVVVIAAGYDVRKGVVPNLITLGPLPIAPIVHALALRGTHGPFDMPGPLFGALLSLTGAILCALVPLVMFRFSLIGGADVKLLATLGALLTPHYGLEAELYALLLAAFFVPLRLAFRGELWRTIRDSAVAAVRAALPNAAHRPPPRGAMESLRFSPFICLGTAAAVLLPAATPAFLP
jgi:prepilin peptidase CpaA